MSKKFDVDIEDYKYGFSDTEKPIFKTRKGLDEKIVRQISEMKGEPAWMLDMRLRAYQHFVYRPMPTWGSDKIHDIDFDNIYYYLKPAEKTARSWDDVPEDIKNTFDRLGIPEAEQKFLAGVGGQYDCLAHDSRVYTTHGIIPISEIESGDTVFAFDEIQNRLMLARVKGKAYKGDQEVFAVNVSTFTIEVTNNHPFLTLSYHRKPGNKRGRYRREWKYLCDLKPGDLVAVAKKLPDAGQSHAMTIPKIKTEVIGRNQTGGEYIIDISNRYNKVTLPKTSSVDLMWWLGFYIGDGFIDCSNKSDKARIDLAIPATDKYERLEMNQVTQKLFDISTRDNGKYRIRVNSTIIARYLEVNGFSGNAHIKRIPDWVYTLPENERLAFLGGYIDADGCVRDNASNHDIFLSSANPSMLEDAKAIASLCGIKTSNVIRVESKHPFDKERTMIGYRLQFSGNFDKLGCRSPKRTERMNKRKYYHDYSSAKGTCFRRHTNEFIGFAKIESIVSKGVKPTYDIEVDGPHNFVAEGLIVHNSEVIYHNIKKDLEKKGVIFLGTDDALQKHPEYFKEYFGTIIPPEDNKFAALNTAVWSGGSFIYVPPNVHIDLPLQAYFRINAKNMGQFERTLIIVDEGAYVHYTEGCFLAGASIRTREGDKPIEEIKVDDEVFTHKGRYRKVYNIMQRPYSKMIYHIRYFGDTSHTLHVTEEHPLLVVRREKKRYRNKKFSPEWLRADEVKPDDYLAIPVPHVEFASVKDLKELVRCMWCGNGGYDEKNNKFRFNTISRKLAYTFRDTLLQIGIVASINYHKRTKPRKPVYTVVISTRWNSIFGEIVGQPAPSGYAKGSPFAIDKKYMYVPIRSIETEQMNTTVYNFSVEEDESYVGEGVVSHNCTAPVYTTDSLHSAVVEIIIKRGARCRYSTVQNWSNDVYNLVTKRAYAYRDAVMEWVDCNIGCLEEGSTITTTTDVKPIEDIKVGEHVLSYDETTGKLCFRLVLAKRFSGYQPVREVSHGERRLRVTDNHPFYSYHYDSEKPKKLERYQLDYVRADKLTEAIIPCTSIDYGLPYQLETPSMETTFTSDNQYSDSFEATRVRERRVAVIEQTTSEMMWLFGLYLGDGNIYRKMGKNGNTRYATVGFSVPLENRTRQKLMENMDRFIDAKPTERMDGIDVGWSSVELADIFEKNGLLGNAHTKRIPEWVYSTPELHRLSLLAGYIDADGCAITSKRRFLIKSVNKSLLQDAARLATTLGITSRLYTEFEGERDVIIMGYNCTARSSYQMEIPLDKRIFPYLSHELRMKAESIPSAKSIYNRTVGRSNIKLPDTVKIVNVSVGEPTTKKVPTWDIEVAGTGNFISQGFIVHNSKLTMKYPAVWLMEPGARGEVLSIAFAGEGQYQDAGAKMVHAAPHTSSVITSKSISRSGGRSSYRGLIKVAKGATGSKSNVVCDALILDDKSASDTYPYIEVEEDKVSIGHEASVTKVSEEQLFYLMSRGLDEEQASSMIVSGFIEPIVKELPMEYALEMNRLIELEMEGSVG